MAGDWIPMRCDLADDPAVIAIAEETGSDIDAVVGKLHKLWSWANRHLADGNAPSVTEKWIDAKVSVTGFARAMQKTGWLTIEKAGITFPKFDSWNSQSAKKRQLTAKRVANHKRKSGNAQGNAPSVTEALPKEEKSIKPPYPPTESNGSSGRPKWEITKTDIQTDAAALRWLTSQGASHGLPDNHETRALVLAARIQVETSREIRDPVAAFVGLLKGIANGKRDSIGDDNLTAGKRNLRDYERINGQTENAIGGFTELAERIAGQ